MKRALAGGILLALLGSVALALIATNSPIIGPTETGEWSAMQQQVVDVARLKPGMTVATAGGSASAATLTANTAAIAATWPANLTIVSDATATLTWTTTKAQALGDGVLCTLDRNGSAAAAVPFVAGVALTAGQVVVTLSNSSATSPAAAVIVYCMIITQGNGN